MNGKIKFNPNKISRELSYFLGMLWADGHLSKDKHYRIYLSINEDDGRKIEKIITPLGDIKVKLKVRQKQNWKNQICFYFGDKDFHTFLKNFDYLEKSFVSPDKILSILDESCKRYFLLGLIDGDGGFYFNKKNYIRNFHITSSYDQDWSYMINISKKLSIDKYEILKRETKSGKNSVYRINNKKDIKKISDYIYFDKDFIPLCRKYNISKEIVI